MARDATIASPGISPDLQRAVETFVGELSKLTGQEQANPNIAPEFGLPGGVGGGGLLDLQVTVGGKTFDVQVALPDKSTPPLWGFQVVEGTNPPMAEVIIQSPEIWKISLGIPQAYGWHNAGNTAGFTLKTLSLDVHRGAEPGPLKFS